MPTFLEHFSKRAVCRFNFFLAKSYERYSERQICTKIVPFVSDLIRKTNRIALIVRIREQVVYLLRTVTVTTVGRFGSSRIRVYRRSNIVTRNCTVIRRFRKKARIYLFPTRFNRKTKYDGRKSSRILSPLQSAIESSIFINKKYLARWTRFR